MSKNSGKTLTGSEILKRTLPIVISLVLIVAVALTVVLVKRGNNRKPVLSNGEETYFELGNLNVTNNELYTAMKQNYGVSELIRLVDNQIYKDQIAAVNEDELKAFVIKSLYSVDDIEDYDGDPQEEWDDLIDSLLMNNLIKKSEIDDKNFTNSNSKVWSVVKDYYRLQFARDSWAKAEYVKKYKEEMEEAGTTLFTDEQIKTYYDENYTGKVEGLFIPFTSSDAAYAMMKKYGINTQSASSINADGWVKSSYDYNSTYSITDADRFTEAEVKDLFFKMYNEVLSYYNNGNDIITSDAIDNSINYPKSIFLAKKEVEAKIDALDKITSKVTLPTEVLITGGEKATLAWSISDNSILTLNDNVLTLASSEATESDVEVTLTCTLTVKVSETESYTDKVEIKHDAAVPAEAQADVTVTVDTVAAQQKGIFTTEFAENPGNDYSKFSFDTASLTAIDSTLATYLKVGGTLKLSNDPDEFVKSYTVAPVSGTNYSFLMIKFAETSANTLDGNDSLKNEIVEKLLVDLETEDNANKMIYENRIAHGFKIYDKYLEAVYQYNFNYFYETTLKLTDHVEFETTKKREKVNAATVEVNGTTIAITADQLFSELESKYGVTTVVDFVNAYQLLNDEKYNTVYNPYTEEVYDKDVLKELLNAEVSSFRNNFEMDYFTYSYLSYYGFIPNFPATYGWNDFRVDYFGALSDKDLLVSNKFGGQVYSDAYQSMLEDVYPNKDELVQAEMEKVQNEFYSLDVLNLIVSIDTNYDGTYDTNDVNGDDDEWTASQNELAKELAKLIFAKASETGATSFSDQLKEVVNQYNKALYNNELADNSFAALVDTPLANNNIWAKYKKAGLVVKFETSNTYTNSSSLVEEFLDQLQVLWDDVKAMDLIGETLDAPIICAEPFESSYGYHYIAATKTTKAEDLPTAEQLDIYKALSDLNEVKDLTFKYKKELIEQRQKAYDDMLAKYNKESDFAFDEDTTNFLKETYDAAVTEVEGGDELTEMLVAFLKANTNTNSFKANSADRFEQLSIVVEVTEKQLSEAKGE